MAARTNNKFTSINFNDVFEKKIPSSSNASNQPKPSTSSYSSNRATSTPYKSHQGRMLVLTRPASHSAPTPKPISTPPPTPTPTPTPAPPSLVPDPARPGSDTDPISLRPQGRTGPVTTPAPSSYSPLSSPTLLGSSAVSPRTDKFVPPHLRPGFVGKEERPEPAGRPKSGGYDRVRRGGDSDLGRVAWPGVSGSRPSSSG